MRTLIFTVPLLFVIGCSSGGSGSGGSHGGDPTFAESEPNDAPAQALDMGSLTKGGARGFISATAAREGLADGDRDLFRLTAPGDGFLRVELVVPPGSDFDLALLDDAGRHLATSRADNRDPAAGPSELLHHRLRGGTAYLVEVGGFSGAAGDYTFSFEVRPDLRSGPVTPASSGTDRVGDLGGARCFHGGAALPDGRAIVGGGTTEAGSQADAILSAVDTTEVFDPETGTFSPGPLLGAARFGVTATPLPDGRVLFAGGDLAGTAALYDPRTGSMTSTDLPMAGGDRYVHSASLLPCGRILLTGGVRLILGLPPTAERLATSEIFDPKDLSFRAGPPLRAARFSHAASVLADGRVLLTGGEGRADSEVVDISDAVFESLPGPALGGVRDDHTSTVLDDGRVLLAGGQDGTGRSLDTLELLDDPGAASSSAFQLLAARLSEARSDHQAILLPSGQVLLLGGESDPGTGDPDLILVSVDLFEPAGGAVVFMPDLVSGRDDHRAFRLRDGRILVTGGEDAASLSIRDAEAYDPR